MTKDVKFFTYFSRVFFLFKTHADISLIEFKKPHFVEKRKNLELCSDLTKNLHSCTKMIVKLFSTD